jgi:hypothetical protein
MPSPRTAVAAARRRDSTARLRGDEHLDGLLYLARVPPRGHTTSSESEIRVDLTRPSSSSSQLLLPTKGDRLCGDPSPIPGHLIPVHLELGM